MFKLKDFSNGTTDANNNRIYQVVFLGVRCGKYLSFLKIFGEIVSAASSPKIYELVFLRPSARIFRNVRANFLPTKAKISFL